MSRVASRSARILSALVGSLAAALLAPGCSGEDVGAAHQPLTAACIEHGDAPPADAWICGQQETVECNSHDGAWIDHIYVVSADGQTCGSETLTVSQPGPFPVGTYSIDVTVSLNGGAPAPACSSTLVVQDTTPPAATVHDVELWPPNHKVHHIAPADCVTLTDVCDAAPRLWFTSASSDEPDDSIGDGSTTGDIANFGCDGVDLLSERQGTGDGRVYTLGWHAEDAAGNVIEGTCHVVVPHDQSGAPAVDSGVDHHVDLAPGTCQ